MVPAQRRNRAEAGSDTVTASGPSIRRSSKRGRKSRCARRTGRMLRYPADMTDVEVFIDPSCPWAWVTSRWLRDVAPQRDLFISWRSYCLEIRDDYDVAPTVPEAYRQQALDGHAVSHRMLRIFEAARAEEGEEAVDRLYAEWGGRNFAGTRPVAESLLTEGASGAGLAPGAR